MNSTVVGRKDTLLVEPNRARSVALGAPNEVNAQLAGKSTARHRRTGTSDNGWYALRRHELLDNMLKRFGQLYCCLFPPCFLYVWVVGKRRIHQSWKDSTITICQPPVRKIDKWHLRLTGVCIQIVCTVSSNDRNRIPVYTYPYKMIRYSHFVLINIHTCSFVVIRYMWSRNAFSQGHKDTSTGALHPTGS
jgi:hypothetical protein